jgi:hypothetical protein
MSGSAAAAGRATNPGAMAPRPFITGSREIESHTYDNTQTMTAGGGQTFPTYDFVTDGYVSGVYIYVTSTTSGNSAAVAYAEDGPWNALLTVQFSDVSNRPIIGPMSGWELKECIKYGGYYDNVGADPANSQNYSATTGTGSTGGSFSFILHLPIEFVHRNAMGSLTNLSNAAVFRLDMTLNGSNNIFSTAPTTLATVRVRLQQHGWMESAGRDPFGNPAAIAPPAVDSVQYWERQTYAINSGSVNFRFTPFEGHVRNVIFVLRDSSNTRSGGETNWPDPLRLHYDATIPIDRLKAVWQDYVEKVWGFTAALGANPTNGKENGVYPITYARDFANAPGAEQCFGYLYVSAGTAIRFDGQVGGSGSQTLSVLWNYVNPAGGNPLALTGGK